eukprot:5633478-Alexandrium_andersonii.AAC.1
MQGLGWERGGSNVDPATFLNPAHGLSEVLQFGVKVPDNEARAALEVRNLDTNRPKNGIRPRGT